MCSVFWLFWLSYQYLAVKWLARNTSPRKPNYDEGIVSTKPRCVRSVYDFLGWLYCLIVWCVCIVPRPYVIYYCIPISRYCLFVLKVPLNNNQQSTYWLFRFTLDWMPWRMHGKLHHFTSRTFNLAQLQTSRTTMVLQGRQGTA